MIKTCNAINTVRFRPLIWLMLASLLASQSAGGLLRGRRRDGAEAGGGGGAEGEAGSAGSAHGSPADPPAPPYQQVHSGAPAPGRLLQGLPFQVCIRTSIQVQRDKLNSYLYRHLL